MTNSKGKGCQLCKLSSRWNLDENTGGFCARSIYKQNSSRQVQRDSVEVEVEGCCCGKGDREILHKCQSTKVACCSSCIASVDDVVLVRLDYTRLGRRGKPFTRVNNTRPSLHLFTDYFAKLFTPPRRQ